MSYKENKNFKFKVVDSVIVLILAVMFLLGGMFFAKYKETKAFFNIEDTSVDYIIQMPSKSQIDEIGNMKHVESITPYLYNVIDSEINSKTVRFGFYIVETAADLGRTTFSDSLLIKKSTESYDNELFVSDDFAKANSLKLGDELTLNVYSQRIKYNVKAIYFGDRRNVGGVVFAIKTGDLEKAIDLRYGADYKYSGAYIHSNNCAETEKWLKEYKPLGDLRSRDEFDSDELYQAYLENRNKTDYTLTTFYKDKYLKTTHNRYDGEMNRNKILFIVVQAVSFIAMLIYIAARVFGYFRTEVAKDIRHAYSQKQEKKMFSKYLLVVLVLSVVLAIGLMTLNGVIFGIGMFESANILGFMLAILPSILVWAVQAVALKKRFFSKS